MACKQRNSSKKETKLWGQGCKIGHFENCPISIDLIANCDAWEVIADCPLTLGNVCPTRDLWSWSNSGDIHRQQISHLVYFRHLPSWEGCLYQKNKLFTKKPKKLGGPLSKPSDQGWTQRTQNLIFAKEKLI